MNRKSDADFLHSRGWDYLGEVITKGGHIKKLWRSRRTGMEMGQNQAANFQFLADAKEKSERDKLRAAAAYEHTFSTLLP